MGLSLGEKGLVFIGIVNHEQERTSYIVKVRISGEIDGQTKKIQLAHEEEWQNSISFCPTTAGDSQKVEFLLYKDDNDTPYSDLHLWVDVLE